MWHPTSSHVYPARCRASVLTLRHARVLPRWPVPLRTGQVLRCGRPSRGRRRLIRTVCDFTAWLDPAGPAIGAGVHRHSWGSRSRLRLVSSPPSSLLRPCPVRHAVLPPRGVVHHPHACGLVECLRIRCLPRLLRPPHVGPVAWCLSHVPASPSRSPSWRSALRELPIPFARDPPRCCPLSGVPTVCSGQRQRLSGRATGRRG
jgi:hypothetical protein